MRIQESETPREELEHATLLAALSMVRILENEGRYQPFPPVPGVGERDPDERWLYAGERVARVSPEEFPEYFALERCQREVGLVVGADDEELDRRLAAWRVPRALVKGAERLAERARRVTFTATRETERGSRASS
ncbi:MAG: hypothetical protein IPJ19_04120 [Planctomycetes bacterium]|nr:hypothetical protein [Planctomycetota bacterium]